MGRFDERALGSQTDLKNAETSRMCAATVVCVIFILFAILTVYLGIYGYNETDPAQCWVVYGLSVAATTRAEAETKAEAAGISVDDGYPIDMHKIFTIWCRWGLWQNSAFIICTIGWLSVGAYIPFGVKRVGTIAGIAWSIGTVIWLVTGAIWRYSYGGRVAAGDKIERPPLG